jgi:hypothetical protein
MYWWTWEQLHRTATADATADATTADANTASTHTRRAI